MRTKLIAGLVLAFVVSGCSNATKLTTANTSISNNANTEVLKGGKVWTDTKAKVDSFDVTFVNPINEYGVVLSDFKTVEFYYAIQNGRTAIVETTLELEDQYRSILGKLNKDLKVKYKITANPVSKIIVSK